MVIGRAAPLRVGNNAVISRVPSHVILLRKGCQCQRRRHHLHARILVSDPENLLHSACFLFTFDKIPRRSGSIAQDLLGRSTRTALHAQMCCSGRHPYRQSETRSPKIRTLRCCYSFHSRPLSRERVNCRALMLTSVQCLASRARYLAVDSVPCHTSPAFHCDRDLSSAHPPSVPCITRLHYSRPRLYLRRERLPLPHFPAPPRLSPFPVSNLASCTG